VIETPKQRFKEEKKKKIEEEIKKRVM